MRAVGWLIAAATAAMTTAAVAQSSEPSWPSWRASGSASWRIDGQGVVIVAAKAGQEGWRTDPANLQDVRVTLRYRCSAACAPALRLREDGAQAIEVPLGGVAAGNASRVDSAGARTPLGKPAEGGGVAAPGQWVNVAVTLRGSTLNMQIDRRRTTAEVRPITAGSVSLGVVGAGEVAFADVAISDLTRRAGAGIERLSERFEKLQLNPLFYAEGVATGDINGDGVSDVVAGPLYYLGPDYQEVRELAPATAASPNSFVPAFQSHVRDFTGDGKADILTVGFNTKDLQNGAFRATLYANPGVAGRHWSSSVAVPAITSEVTRLVDLRGDGGVQLLVSVGSRPGFAVPNPADPTQPWTFTAVGPTGGATAHGLGAGDINGDGRTDILTAVGWYEQPPAGLDGVWLFHPAAFGGEREGRTDGGAEMYAYDVNGDGLADVIGALDGHGWGLAWFEQERDPKGGVKFTRHLITRDEGPASAPGEFSQIHALELADIDGDGLQDIVTGKRWWAHLEGGGDPDSDGEPVLYWFGLQRTQGQVHYVPHLIHNQSGLGTQLRVVDLNQDGKPDILAAGRRGVFLFRSR